MELPANTQAVADKFPEVSAERKNQIIAHLAQLPHSSGVKSVQTMIENGGSEGRFVAALFGKSAPGPTDAPQNKQASIPGKK